MGPAFGLWCSTNPAMTEHVASTGIDWIAWDMQHGLTSDDDLAGLLELLGPASPRWCVSVPTTPCSSAAPSTSARRV